MSDSLKTTNSMFKSIERRKNFLRSMLFRVFDWIYTKSFFGIFQKLPRRFVKFLFVGGINTLFGYSTYALFVALSLKPAHALTISYILSIFWNFKTTGSIVFKNKDNRLIFKFFLSYIFTFLVNKYSLEFLIEGLNVNEYLAEAIVIPPVAVLSFIIFKTFIFVQKNENCNSYKQNDIEADKLQKNSKMPDLIP